MDKRRSVISQNWKHHSQQQTLSTIAISNRWGVIASACAYHRYLPVSHPPLPLVSHLLYTWNAADCGRRTVWISSSGHSTTTTGSVCHSPQLYFDTGAGSVCILPQPYFDTGAGSVCISPQPYFDTGTGSVISRLRVSVTQRTPSCTIFTLRACCRGGGGFESTKQEQDGDLTITKAEKKEDNRSTTRKTKDSCLEKVDNNPPLYTSDEETNERVTQGGN